MISVDIGCVSKAKEEKPIKIAVDIGYSSVKGVSEHGRVMFPSVVAPASEDRSAAARSLSASGTCLVASIAPMESCGR